ncbi:hypothetical protein [Desmospora profundinema]|uniref:Uncharacterized protein n=1 Tax=Desmospora profundinema TaxID=1571184 RepID=A0ABU1IJH6_9BACL|nr:hypothetical protein [Desmospora profundinema]MDR6224903.1 hypothetical protein [Desmospora profundinema]
MKQKNQAFRLVNLEARSDAIRRISEAESELKEILDTPVALIAYVKENDENQVEEGRREP